MKKEKYIELCMKELDLTHEEAVSAVGYLSALIKKVIKNEIEQYEKQSK